MKPIPRKLTDNIAFMLHHTALDYQVHFDQQMQSLQLTRSQWLLLSHLYFCNGINQKDLAELMDIGKGAVGKLAQKLEAAGWIRREPDVADRRAFNLHITSKALPVVKNLVDLQLIETDHSLAGFGQEEIEQLRSYLRRIRRNLVEIPPSRKWRGLKDKTLAAIREAGL